MQGEGNVTSHLIFGMPLLWIGWGTLVDYFQRGGPVMYPLLVCSLAGLVVIIERSWVLHRIKDDAAEVIGRVRRALHARDLDAAVRVCDTIQGPIANTVKAGLLQVGKPAEEIERIMEIVATQEIARLERFLWVLATVANIAPLFGFLGTVTGMINAFDRVAEVGLGNPRAVAGGISEALITTAAGLIIALPTQAAYNYLTTRVNKISLSMETAGAMLLETLKELESYLPRPEMETPMAGR
ncbi:Biopolymer transport protein ExbB [bacterium HR10]|nr:Biopolymer transport protein ExbB [bacterium HR10]